jgi:hypothetical protein
VIHTPTHYLDSIPYFLKIKLSEKAIATLLFAGLSRKKKYMPLIEIGSG